MQKMGFSRQLDGLKNSIIKFSKGYKKLSSRVGLGLGFPKRKSTVKFKSRSDRPKKVSERHVRSLTVEDSHRQATGSLSRTSKNVW